MFRGNRFRIVASVVAVAQRKQLANILDAKSEVARALDERKRGEVFVSENAPPADRLGRLGSSPMCS